MGIESNKLLLIDIVKVLPDQDDLVLSNGKH